ncbi:MAG TPA: SRPBCC domain-containing protein [Kofleriaceae bacterium]|nr:SRPBCC domain-containing protein [Kofleriaceae bacterium]
MLTAEQTKTTIDHPTFTITFKRKLAATPDVVFDAWTKPDEISQWWDPDGAPLRECAIDLRVGGEFKLVNNGHSPPFAGVYRVLERPSLIVFDAMGAVGTVRLDGDQRGTQMTVTIRCANAEHLEHFVKLGVADGTERTLNNLVARIAAKTA